MAEYKNKNNKFQQRMDEQAAAMEKAYAELRETYDDPTDEQILAVAGNNLRGYQKKIGNKAGNWGTAFGSNALWGTLNKDTRAALEKGYQAGLEAQKKPLTDRRAESLYTLGEGEGAKKVTRGMQIDARNWGDNITDTDNITPEQVRKLNEIMTSGGFTNFTIPTQQVTTKNEKGEDEMKDVEQNISLYDLLESASPEEIDALEYLGFVDEDGAYVRPHNETWEEKLARREREQARIELAAQQKALERQKARAGLAELAAGIGDIIKASGGALVEKREFDKVYNSLTEQQKTNFNNYLARMQALKEQEKAKQKEAADRAYQEKLLKEKYAREDALLKAAQEREDAQRIQDQEWELEKIHARGANSLAVAREKNKQKIDKFNNAREISYGGVDYTFADNTKNEVVYALLGIVKPYFTESNGYHSMLSGIEDSRLSEFDRNTNATIAVLSALESLDSYFTDEDKSRIKKILYDYSKGRVRGSASAGNAIGTQSVTAQDVTTGQEQGKKKKIEW